jgi:hypothetical protein
MKKYKPAANIALAIWLGDEYILSFLFAINSSPGTKNNAEQKFLASSLKQK